MKEKMVKYGYNMFTKVVCPKCGGTMTKDWNKFDKLEIYKCISCGTESEPPKKVGRPTKDESIEQEKI